jgi:hypothetical protein
MLAIPNPFSYFKKLVYWVRDFGSCSYLISENYQIKRMMVFCLIPMDGDASYQILLFFPRENAKSLCVSFHWKEEEFVVTILLRGQGSDTVESKLLSDTIRYYCYISDTTVNIWFIHIVESKLHTLNYCMKQLCHDVLCKGSRN